MNRRRFIGGLASALLWGSGLAHRAFAAPALPRYPHPQQDVGEASLCAAIEALFPAGVVHSAGRAYEEYPFGVWEPLRVLEDGHVYVGPPVQRCIHRTFKLAYILTENKATDARLRLAMYRAMFRTFVVMSEAPANRGAVLVWRLKPQEQEKTFHRDPHDIGDGIPVRSLRVRASLRQTGWRERLEVPPHYIGVHTDGMPCVPLEPV